MTQDEIIDLKVEALEAIRIAEYHLLKAKAELKAIQKLCTHPNKHKYSAIGEVGDFCPDCEYQT